MPAFDRSMHRTMTPPASPARPRSGDVVIELIASPAVRKLSASVRTVPQAGFDSDIGALPYFLYCVCGSEIFSAKPITSCPCCHRPA